MPQFLTFILFCNKALHVSDGLSVHHQEFKTIHTASGMCQTDTAACLLGAPRWTVVTYFKPTIIPYLSVHSWRSWWWVDV